MLIRVIYRAREDVSHFVYGFVAINPARVVKITQDKSDLRTCKTEAIIFASNKLESHPFVFTYTPSILVNRCESGFEKLDSYRGVVDLNFETSKYRVRRLPLFRVLGRR